MLNLPKTEGAEKIAGVIGFPIAHSISPNMHNAAFEELKLPYKYLPLEVAPPDLKKAIKQLRDNSVIGFNVTVPHKEHVMPLLDEIDELARVIGAVNTVKNENGKLIGYNTDGPGFIASLTEDLKFDVADKNVIVFGAGGAAKAVCISLAKAGAKSIIITDVVIEKAKDLAIKIKQYYNIDCHAFLPALLDLQHAILKAHLIINATPMGMHPAENESPLEEDFEVPFGILAYDLVYNPPLTKFLKQALENGAKVSNGLNMLIRQGALAFEIFTSKKAPFATMKKAAEKKLLL